MNKEILDKLIQLKPILKDKFGIEEFAIFGSVAKGLANKDSDVDIVILKMNIKKGFALIEVKYFLEKQLNKKVDIGTYASMKTFIKNRIKKDLIHV
ncbi:hypothetical protein FHQ18_07700 [Deferribacter autotrophicus]|uniref:Polymerase nucleotidyl transferase domain-containing protein n=1 Tax=Deferribacter autotrophicus TaxID=500465 RepID=A0A5A8F1L4_9BACT|nr:nucleotidyltransferase domain-containing protein [Deferribacter autotrophicus]KAA0257621.1 hypothetical protein FHQ18_07700 [Deferribacter autotrophicus]